MTTARDDNGAGKPKPRCGRCKSECPLWVESGHWLPGSHSPSVFQPARPRHIAGVKRDAIKNERSQRSCFLRGKNAPVDHDLDWPEKHELPWCCRAETLHQNNRLVHAVSPGGNDKHVRLYGAARLGPQTLATEAPVVDVFFELRKAGFTVFDSLCLRLGLKGDQFPIVVLRDNRERADKFTF